MFVENDQKARTYPWFYNPGSDDLCSPNVIRGEAIEPGEVVRIAREHQPKLHGWTRHFAVIEDRQGNLQSVWKRALTRE